ncbi:MAG: hypothetical protein VZR06_15230 [Butyrivibrio sp.]|jgi:hypothetical protein|uniref:hypothetical protein n=1 Tax=Butyrivibrio sp. LB2008 TaxID=1408305 RepID=UPI0004790858|nr:hypothetical protein [Butyrivibrio sp. LB2008]MEE3496511.1 hypothetical protein [Butyrivibrio sp.]
MANEREDLIHSLAKSMGVGDAQKARGTSGKYNAETGTMYCNGHIISRTTIEQASAYFNSQYRRLAEIDDENVKQMASIYEVAKEAINMIVTPSDSTEL